MDRVNHFEIPANDVERTKKFYHESFGWHLHTMKMGTGEYTIVHTVPTDEKTGMIKKGVFKDGGAINGGLMKRGDFFQHPVITVIVKDMDKAVEMIKKSGGEIIREKMPVEKIGFAAYFKDTEGNVMGLFQPTGMMM